MDSVPATMTAARRRAALAYPLIAALVGAMLLAAIWAPAARAATISVTTSADELNSDGDCSLREAIQAANSDAPVDACLAGSGADSILLPAGVYAFAAGDDPAGSFLELSSDLTLAGAGLGQTVIDAGGLDRVLAITGGSSVSIADLTITGGAPGIRAGSGLWIDESAASLSGVEVAVNRDTYAIYLVGAATLTIADSIVRENSAGGIYTQPASTLTIVRSTISGNSGAANGGGVLSGGRLTVVNSTISGNSAAGHGGGVLSAGQSAFYNATLADNTADVEGNGFGDGGGLYSLELPALLRNTLIAGNRDGSPLAERPDCGGGLLSEGYSLIGDLAGCGLQSGVGDLTNLDAALEPLGANGGAGQTHALGAGSPAIDAGEPGGCLDQLGGVLTSDQRGFLRPADGGAGGGCDIGAYEYGSPGAPTATATATAPPSATSTASPSATATAPVGGPTAGPSPSPTATSTAPPAEGPPPDPLLHLPLLGG